MKYCMECFSEKITINRLIGQEPNSVVECDSCGWNMCTNIDYSESSYSEVSYSEVSELLSEWRSEQYRDED